MNSTKPAFILNSLSQPELNRFDKYISTQFDGAEVMFWQYIKPFCKERNIISVDKQKCWKLVFGNKHFNALKYARLLSDFTKILEAFLVNDQLQKNEIDKQLSLLEIYNSRAIPSCIPPLLKHTSKQLSNFPYRDEQYYKWAFQLDEQQHNFVESQDSRQEEKHLQQTIHSLDTLYLLQKLKYSAMVLHYQKFIAIDSSLYFLEDVLHYSSTEQFAKTPLIQIYVSIIYTLQDKDGVEHYRKLTTLLKAHASLFTKEELENIYAYALNFCIRKINQGDLDFQQHIFELYKQMLKDGSLTHRGFISPWDFKNIVTIALRVKAFDWANKFINEQSIFIPKKDRKNAITFNRARYYFAIKKYDQVLQLLGTVEYDDVFYQLDAKTTLMKTYFELDEFQPLQSLKESFRILLSRKKGISETQRLLYGNFIKLCLKLYRIDIKDNKKVNALKKEIETTSNVADMGWIKEKLLELV